MSSDDSDVGPHQKRKRKSQGEQASSPGTSGSPIIGRPMSLRRRPFRERNVQDRLDSSDSDLDSGSSTRRYNKRKKVRRIATDSDSDTSDSTIVKRNRKTGRIHSESDADTEMSDRGFEGSSSSQWESDFSDTDVEPQQPKPETSTTASNANIDSDSSYDGQSEKCPICLISFKKQEIGTPECCDHMFCLECIQEWSKNMNTCPVDRQEYTLILVRSGMDGKVVKQVPVEKPSNQNDVDIVEDPTFCEICGSGENEDRMLLCDGCDLGFHLYCLTPPLSEVPSGSWYCNVCADDDQSAGLENVRAMLYDIRAMLNGLPQGLRRNQLPRSLRTLLLYNYLMEYFL